MDLSSFLQYIKFEKRYSANTLVAYENDLTQFAAFLKEHFEVTDAAVKSTFIRSWIVSLMEKKVSARSINRKLSTLKSYYRFLQKTGVISINPMSKVQAPKPGKRLPEFIPQQHTDRLMNDFVFGNDFAGMRNKMIIQLLYSTGMRRAELLQLKDEDIHFNQQQLKVLGKGNKERMIPFNPELAVEMKNYISVRNQHFNLKKFEAFIVSNKGIAMQPRQLYQLVHVILKQVTTLKKTSPHVLRHTFATQLLNNGADINAIKELLGHSSLAATQVYTHNTITKLQEIYKKSHPKA